MTSHIFFGFIGLGLLHLLFIPFVVCFGLLTMAFWIWMLVDCVRRVSRGESNQIGWLIVILFTHFLGAVIYFLFGRRNA